VLESEQFFSKEKNQKTFMSCPPASIVQAAQEAKVFCFFFLKKKSLPSLELPSCP